MEMKGSGGLGKDTMESLTGLFCNAVCVGINVKSFQVGLRTRPSMSDALPDFGRFKVQESSKSQGDGFLVPKNTGTDRSLPNIAESTCKRSSHECAGRAAADVLREGPHSGHRATKDVKKRQRAPASENAAYTVLHNKASKQSENSGMKIAKGGYSKDIASGLISKDEDCAQLQGAQLQGGEDSCAVPANATGEVAHPCGDKDQKGHDKYCHFCQHVKINMLGCTTAGCTHRYCIYCLGFHLCDGTDPATSKAWMEGGWKCPTCRSGCCCSTNECTRNHRHCKAYRYRLRRADAANLRATAALALVSLAALGDKGRAPEVTPIVTIKGRVKRLHTGDKLGKRLQTVDKSLQTVDKAAVHTASNLAPEATHVTKKSPEQNAVVAGGGKEQDGGSRSVGEVGGMGGMRRLAWERGEAGCEGVEGLDTNTRTRLAPLSPLQTYAENGITKQGQVCIKLESLSMLFERKAMVLSDANGLQASTGSHVSASLAQAAYRNLGFNSHGRGHVTAEHHRPPANEPMRTPSGSAADALSMLSRAAACCASASACCAIASPAGNTEHEAGSPGRLCTNASLCCTSVATEACGCLCTNASLCCSSVAPQRTTSSDESSAVRASEHGDVGARFSLHQILLNSPARKHALPSHTDPPTHPHTHTLPSDAVASDSDAVAVQADLRAAYSSAQDSSHDAAIRSQPLPTPTPSATLRRATIVKCPLGESVAPEAQSEYAQVETTASQSAVDAGACLVQHCHPLTARCQPPTAGTASLS